MTQPAPGMDHDLYAYSAIPERVPLVWPEGRRLAVWVLLHLEYWDLVPPEGARRDARFVDEYGSFFPEYKAFTQREYGARQGLWRVLQALEGRGLKLTVAANAVALTRYPQAVSALQDLGVEWVAHGEAQTRLLTSRMTVDEERAVIARTTETFEEVLGVSPTAWLGPDSSESPHTPGLLAEAGYTTLLDWPNDDAPYAMTTTPPMVSVPNQMEWDDVTALWLRRVPTERYPDLVGEAAEALAAEGGRSFCLSLHPWVIGQPRRVRYLRLALDRMGAIDGLWPATAGEIAAQCREQWGI